MYWSLFPTPGITLRISFWLIVFCLSEANIYNQITASKLQKLVDKICQYVAVLRRSALPTGNWWPIFSSFNAKLRHQTTIQKHASKWSVGVTEDDCLSFYVVLCLRAATVVSIYDSWYWLQKTPAKCSALAAVRRWSGWMSAAFQLTGRHAGLEISSF